MATFFIIISLLLNLLAFLAIILLYLRQNRLSQMEKKQEKMIQEMEEVLSSYMLEMKEENEIFMKRLKHLGLNKETVLNTTSELSTTDISDDHSDSTKTERAIKIGKIAPFLAVKAYKKNVNNSKFPIEKSNSLLSDDKQAGSENASAGSEDHFQAQNMEFEQKDDDLKLLLNEVYLLQQQGFSVEDIAKKLNKGKTEIELLLKFHHQNEQE
ncbi:hypothetical protein [Bacillus methanolicus]|uniref:Coupling factor for flagellin transcription and translation n=1 Tax=Bacillus methanolicus (strain MGA3 / ATCC 53907) TaxID=796606 RepID=I3DZD7_BACMM|nr:hypothetical protein [Bacillus methanolicus]AIE59678.1 hypothetical protein BMMGA3_06250 [Bacillus methanolicus MGA3]EIJ79608.1 hypothetical protein MGA3_14671 [Bacillus methanolicus MGA3]